MAVHVSCHTNRIYTVTQILVSEIILSLSSCSRHKENHIVHLARSTVMFLSFRTDRSGQTVQTRSSLIRVYTVCNSLCIFWMHYSKEKPLCLTFRVITANFWVSKILGLLQYFSFFILAFTVNSRLSTELSLNHVLA